MEASEATRFHDLLDALQHHAERDPDRTAFTFVGGEGQDDATISFAGLLERTIRIGSALQSRSEAGERVLVMLPPSLDFVPTFLGALWAGLVPCVAYPPTTWAAATTIASSFREVEASFVIANEAVTAGLAATPDWTDLGLPTPEALVGLESPGDRRKRRETKLAFLQYTSGSTSSPKAIRVTREGLAKHCEQSRAAFGYHRHTVSVSWFPVNHGFGLFTGVVCPLYVGHGSVQLSPQRFVEKPTAWVKTIDRFRATASIGPNSAYERLCVALSRLEPSKLNVDLSCWRLAGMGGDVLQPAKLSWMRRVLEPFGLSPRALKPAYGLSEATSYVSGNATEPARVVFVDGVALRRGKIEKVASDHPNACGAVGAGRVIAGCEVALVDVVTSRCTDSKGVGEICVRGPGVADGYWRRPAESEAVFRAKHDGTEDRPYLRTGDVGFVDEGELFLCGRRKELISLQGLVLFPSAIEATVRDCAPELTNATLAAFPWSEAEVDGLAIAIETDDLPSDVVERIFAGVERDHQNQCDLLLLAPAGSLPRTATGKVRRVEVASMMRDARLRGVAIRHDKIRTAIGT